MQTNQNETSLIQNILNGDEQSLKTLYQTYQADLFGFIAYHINEEKDVEDIWQETWLVAYRRLDQFKGNSRFFTWLCAIARFKIADFYRKNDKFITSLSETDFETSSINIDTTLIPEEILLSKNMQTQVLVALNTIPENYKQVLILRYMDELSIEAIAKRIKKTYKATESILSRARKAFSLNFQNKKEG